MEKKWTIKAALRTGMGKVRHNNEDAFYFNGNFPALSAMDVETSEQLSIPMNESLFAICDGIGGQSNGEIASYTTVSRMPELQKKLRNRDFGVVLQRWIQETSKAVQSASANGGCTLAMVYFQNNAVRIAHIGDSRVYRYHEGNLTQLTMDHSKVQMLVNAGVITPEQARTHPQRHVITRYIGMPSDTVICEATLGRAMPAMNRDVYLLCSDGVTDMVDDDKIKNMLAASGDVMDCANSIYDAALNAGGRDNTTVIVLGIQNPDGDDALVLAADDDDNEPTVDDEIPQARNNATSVIDMNITSQLLPGDNSKANNLSISIKVMHSG